MPRLRAKRTMSCTVRKYGLVAQLGDQRQLLLDQRARLRAASPPRPAPAQRPPRSVRAARSWASARRAPARAGTGSAARRGRSVQRSAMRSGLREQRRRIDRRPARGAVRRWRSPLGNRRCAGLGDRGAVADRGQRVLQGAAAARVHVHVAAATSGRPSARAQRQQRLESARHRRGPRCSSTASHTRSAKRCLQPGALPGIGRSSGHPQREQAAAAPPRKSVAQQPVLALRRAAAAVVISWHRAL